MALDRRDGAVIGEELFFFCFAWRSLQYACGAVERLWSTDSEITAASEKAWVLLAVFQWRRLFLKQTYMLWRSERSVVASFW